MPRTRMNRTTSASLAAVLLAAGWIAGCSTAPATHDWPAEIAQAPAVVRQAYAFADEHPEVLGQIPCYCGCGNVGHTSNYDCYISGLNESGEPVYDGHALGCSICVDITLDTKRLLAEGRSVPEIRAAIDAAYSAFGPSNMR